jgi:hypothetical protein
MKNLLFETIEWVTENGFVLYVKVVVPFFHLSAFLIRDEKGVYEYLVNA